MWRSSRSPTTRGPGGSTPAISLGARSSRPIVGAGAGSGSRLGRLDEWFRAPAPEFDYPNGIASLSEAADSIVVAHQRGVTLLVATPDGVRATPVAGATPGLDGLYSRRGRLVGVDNSRPRAERVVSQPIRGAEAGAVRVLAERESAYETPTTGLVAGDTLFYVANAQLGRIAGQAGAARPRFAPLVVLRLVLPP
jgi:hypothetical protein